MKNKLLIITLIGVATVALVSGAYASRGNFSQEGFGRMGGGFGLRSNSGTTQEYQSKITRNVKNIANGVEMTMTTTDSGALSHLNAMYELSKDVTPKNTAIKTEKTKIDNGIKVTMTSDNADVVKLIQERGANGQGFGMMGGGLGIGGGRGNGGFGGRGQGGGCPMFR